VVPRSSGGTTSTASGTAVGESLGNATAGEITGLSINSQTSGVGGTVSATVLGGTPRRPAASIVRLGDVARLEMGSQNYRQAMSFDGHPSVGVAVFQLPGTNALDIADRVKQKMRELSRRFPDGVEYRIAYDTTPFIRESVADVFKTLFEPRRWWRWWCFASCKTGARC